MELRILGPIELWTGTSFAELGPARQRCVLGALLVDAGRPVSLESLIDRVWGDQPPAEVRNVVYTYVTRLRRALAQAGDNLPEPIGLVRSPAGYMVSTDPDAVDLVRFRRLLKNAQKEGVSDHERSAFLQQALKMWRGDALAGMQSEWADGVRESLRQLQREALCQWADSEIRLGRPSTALAELRTALLTDPLSEQLCERLVRALYVEGRTVDALERYESMRQLIAKELGMDPSPRLQQLHQTILRGEQIYAGPDRGGDRRSNGTGQPVAISTLDPSPRLMLPLDLPDFTGRDAELEAIESAMTEPTASRPPAVILVGGGGVGKTALALRWGHRHRATFSDGQLYADLRGSGEHPADPFVVQGRLLRALGADHESIPNDSDERSEVYQRALASRRLLLALDDAVNDEQVQPLLPRSRDTAVLITSRSWLGTPPSACVVQLSTLPHAESVRLLTRMLGTERVNREQAAAAAIARYCDGLPLALRAAATRLNSRPHWSLHRYAERLSDDARRLDELAHNSLSVRACFKASYEALPADAREALRRLTDLPTPDFDPHLACQVLGKDFASVEDACEKLVEAHFLTVVGSAAAHQPARYRLDGLQRSFARELRPGDVSESAGATQLLIAR
ncbi:AfsR/SARP family transcriptional regulator [Mycobacteroides abscessus]|uniref:AfsR/SARP family transcriptional regulator n=1 Tax=Mycobacteroides abscessus TaxID=36809 RepID=UPI000C262223|nr:BTAD domain-containing putative transcriptional regulator [Mycobacteroides abscessus]